MLLDLYEFIYVKHITLTLIIDNMANIQQR